MSDALELWQAKLNYLLREEAIAVGVAERFAVRESIAEARLRIQELEGELPPTLKKELSKKGVEHVGGLREAQESQLRLLENRAIFFEILVEMQELGIEVAELRVRLAELRARLAELKTKLTELTARNSRA